MFGDLFSQRSDYSKGVFYSGHRKFLTNSDHLKPPNELKTKMQARKELTYKKQTDASYESGIPISSFQINFQKKAEASETDGAQVTSKAALLRRQDTTKKMRKVFPGMIVVDKYSSVNKYDWVEEVQAGCRIWTNHSTGEVSTECPWLMENQHHTQFGTNGKPPLQKDTGMSIRDLRQSMMFSSDSQDGVEQSLSKLSRNNSIVPIISIATRYSSNSLKDNSRIMQPSIESDVNLATIEENDSLATSIHELHSEVLDGQSLDGASLEGDEEGTGSLAYNPKDLHELFSLLDSSKKQKIK